MTTIKRLESILGAMAARPVRCSMWLITPFAVAIALSQFPRIHSQALASRQAAITSPAGVRMEKTGASSTGSHAAAPDPKSLVVGGGLHGSLTPPEDVPWRHWLQ